MRSMRFSLREPVEGTNSAVPQPHSIAGLVTVFPTVGCTARRCAAAGEIGGLQRRDAEQRAESVPHRAHAPVSELARTERLSARIIRFVPSG
jgi:hypothetical protein